MLVFSQNYKETAKKKMDKRNVYLSCLNCWTCLIDLHNIYVSGSMKQPI